MKTKLLNTLVLGMVLTATVQGQESNGTVTNGTIRIPMVAPYTTGAFSLQLRPLPGEEPNDVLRRSNLNHPNQLLRYIHAENGHRRGSALWPDVAWRMNATNYEWILDTSYRHEKNGWGFSALRDGREIEHGIDNSITGPSTPEKVRKVADGLYEWGGGWLY